MPHNFGELSTPNIQPITPTNSTAISSGSKRAANGSLQETSQNSSGFSISEYLTKLAKGGDSSSRQTLQQDTTSHINHYANEPIPPVSTPYSHPPPPPKPDTHHAGSQLNTLSQNPDASQSNWWPSQPPPLPPPSTNPPPITSWSREGDPPPATSWPPPRPDVWSSENTDRGSTNWQQSAALDPGILLMFFYFRSK